MASTTNVEEILAQLEALTASPPQDKKLQERLYDAAHKLTLAVEAPLDTVYRVIYSPMLLSSAQTATYMKIFSTLVEKRGPCTTTELAAPTGADIVFTARILRFLASHGLISEVAEGTYEANRLTETLSVNGYRAGMNQTYSIIAPAVIQAPDFFKATAFQNPETVTHTPFQLVNHTTLPAFEWAHLHRPDLVAEFGLWMTALRGRTTWLDVLDFPALVLGGRSSSSSSSSKSGSGGGSGGGDGSNVEVVVDAETPVFVDVGGGIGSQCALLKSKLPDLPGRVILQDLPIVIQHALPTPGVENTAHDFWGEQPVKGARAYYMRTVLHDYPDAKCLAILEKLVAAMGPDSYILIDDIIIPDTGAHARTTEMDYIMMTTLAAMERTRKQWDDLLAAAGLEVLQRVTYLEDTAESIQVVVPRGRKSAA